MPLGDLIARRRSIRAYSEAPVDDDAIGKIIQAANLAPSAGNRQAYEIYLVRDRTTRVEISHAAWGQAFIVQAPVALVFCANGQRCADRYGERGVNLYAVQDATIAATYAMLAATELGLGTVWVGAFDDDGVRRAIKAPAEHRPVAVLPIGHPAQEPPARARRALAELVHEV